MKIKATIYLENQLMKWLRLRSKKTEQSVSHYLNQVIFEHMQEEKEDLKDIKKILKEPTVAFDYILAHLKIKDEIQNRS